ncbi:MAG: hypothetical protein SWL02_17750 [Pseudomonadota bacterium]|nr:hypothetical protein [Pseudomonadota bacterium]
MISRVIKWGIGLSVGLLMACSPKYELQYQYSAANTDQVKSCVMQCNQTRLACQKNNELQFSQCDMQGRTGLYQFENNRVGCDERQTHCEDTVSFNSSAFNHICQLNYRECERAFNACYESCGGEISVKRHCVENCD